MLWTISGNNHFYPKEGEKRIRGERRERVSCSKEDKGNNNQIYTIFPKEKKNHTVFPQEVLGDKSCLGIDCNFLRIVMNIFKLSCDLFLKIQISEWFQDLHHFWTINLQKVKKKPFGNGEQEQAPAPHESTGSSRAQTVPQCVSLFSTSRVSCLLGLAIGRRRNVEE